MVLMKTEFTDVSETRKHLAFEVEPTVVESEIARIATTHSAMNSRTAPRLASTATSEASKKAQRKPEIR